MLEVAYWGTQCNPFLLYGISEISSRLGIDFKRVTNSREMPKDPLALIVPEASFESNYFEDLLVDWEQSAILVGPYASPKLDDLFGVKTVGERHTHDDVSGFRRSSRFPSPMPVFYTIPLLQIVDPAAEVASEVEIDETVCPSVVVRRAGRRLLVRIGPQLFRSTALLLTSSTFQPSSSVKSPNLDSYGRVPMRSTIAHRRGFLRTAVVDYYARIIEDILREIAAARGVALLQKWSVPGPYNFCLCLSHDVDYLAPNPVDMVLSILFDISDADVRRIAGRIVLALFYAVSAMMTHNRDLLALVPQTLHRRLRKHEPFWRLDWIRRLEAQLGIRSSFFFLHNTSRMDSNYDIRSKIVQSAIRQTSEQGFEVCLHADFSATDVEGLKRRKKAIEEAANSNVIGVRAHYLRFFYPETFRSYAQAGLAYDSSVMFSEEVGFRSSTCAPWMVFDICDQETLPLLEIPLTIMDRTLKQRGKMNLDPNEARKICSALIEQVADLHGVLTVDWHNSEMSLKPALDRQWWGVYKSIIEESVKRGSKIMKLGDVFAYWSNRRRVRIDVVRCDLHSCEIEIFCDQELPEFAISISVSDEISNASCNGLALKNSCITKLGSDRHIVTMPLRRGINSLSLAFSR